MALTTINSGGVKDDSIVNADIKSDAAIAGTKVAPDFGSQNIATTGNCGIGTTSPSRSLHISNNGSDGTQLQLTGTLDSAGIKFVPASGDTFEYQAAATGCYVAYNRTDSRADIFVDGSGNCGIGTTSPDQLLHLAATSNGPFIRLENTDTSISANQTFGGIEFESKDSSTGSAGVISKIDCISTAAFDGSSVVGGALRFHTSTTNSISLQERFRINADGSVGINTDVNGNGGLVQIRNNHAYQSGTTDLLTSASKAALRVRTSNDSSKSLYIGGIDDTAEPYLQVGNLHTASGGATASYDLHLQPYGGDVIIGDGNLKVANGKGINFSAYATSGNPSSNLLDDYEEGTWTPTLAFGGGSTGITYATTTGGSYVKIGRQVILHGRLVLTSKGSSTGAAVIGGLPFTAGNVTSGTSGIEGDAYFTYMHNIVGSEDHAHITGFVDHSSTEIDMKWNNDSGDTENIEDSDFESTTSLSFGCTYPTA